MHSFQDVIMHVSDTSHPDHDAQVRHVRRTLQNLDLDPKLLESVIEVGNKVDRLDA